jgi:predicted anti-sigma-YlaC factor YlaD
MKDFFKNKCDIVRDLLPLYADSSCSKEAREYVGIHLITCKECRDYYKEIKSYHENCTIDEAVPDSDKHFAEVMNRLRRRKIIRRSIVSAAIIASLAINAVLILSDD